MGLLRNLRKTLEVARGGEADLDRLTPEQRAKIDAELARVRDAEAQLADSQQAMADALDQQRLARPLRGPGAIIAYGNPVEVVDHAPLLQQHQRGGVRALLREQLSLVGRQAASATDEVASATPQGVADPVERSRIETEERRARDMARVPYLADEHGGVAVTRIVTRGKSQLDDVARHLIESGLAARPDLVYGVHRVPDRISPGVSPHSELGRLVEWDLVHQPVPERLPTGGSVEYATLPAGHRWVKRRIGEPTVVDEELGIALCEVAGIRADQCFGVARAVGIRSPGGGDEGAGLPVARVEAVYVLADRSLRDAVDGLERAAPVDLPEHGRAGARVDVLNWRDIARVVHPQPQRMHLIPSPCAYLPSTPTELLTMYLEVVGIRASDCYAAAVTIDESFVVAGVGDHGVGYSNRGGEEMCVDGKVRRRLHAATHVVVAYDDRPEYVAGRRRWDAYQEEVLQARLELATAAREPLAAVDAADIDNSLLRSVQRASDLFEAIDPFSEGRLPPPYRYCLPLERSP